MTFLLNHLLYFSLCALVTRGALAQEVQGSGQAQRRWDACTSSAKTDTAAENEVEACYLEYLRLNTEETDGRIKREYKRNYWVHDDDLLIFLERRQLFGWQGLKSYFRLDSTVVSTQSYRFEAEHSNLRVKARGDMAFVVLNEKEIYTEPSTEKVTSDMRVTEIFERRHGRWMAVHLHASYQAPRGPQRPVPMVTDPQASLWPSILQGSWKAEDGTLLVASESHVAILGVPGLPNQARYKIEPDEEHIKISSLTSAPGQLGEVRLDVEKFTYSQLIFRIPGDTKQWQWHRVEW